MQGEEKMTKKPKTPEKTSCKNFCIYCGEMVEGENLSELYNNWRDHIKLCQQIPTKLSLKLADEGMTVKRLKYRW